MSPCKFEFLINLIGEKNLEKGHSVQKSHFCSRKFSMTLRFDKFYDTFLSPLLFTVTKMLKKPHNTTDSHHSSRQKHQE